jgi:hypothetical protein
MAVGPARPWFPLLSSIPLSDPVNDVAADPGKGDGDDGDQDGRNQPDHRVMH